MTKLIIEVYGKKDCTLCKEARKVIARVKEDVPFQCKEVDITSCDDLLRRFHEDIPTIFINGKKAFKFKVDENEFRKKVRKEFIKVGITRVMNKKQQQHRYNT